MSSPTYWTRKNSPRPSDKGSESRLFNDGGRKQSDSDENLRYVRPSVQPTDRPTSGLIAISFRPAFNPFPGTKPERAFTPIYTSVISRPSPPSRSRFPFRRSFVRTIDMSTPIRLKAYTRSIPIIKSHHVVSSCVSRITM